MKQLIMLLPLLMAGCSTPESEIANDQRIIDAVYQDVRTPLGFYTEEIPNDSFYKTEHLKNGGTELAADEYNQALEWDLSSTELPLVDVSETELYWQFTHVEPGVPTTIHLRRVFKHAIIDRSGAELNCLNCYQGQINPIWANSNNVKLIIEYMWHFTLDNNPFNSVMESNLTENGEIYLHTIVRAELVRNLSDSECDVIKIYNNLYTVDKTLGFMYKTTEEVRELLTKNRAPCGNE